VSDRGFAFAMGGGPWTSSSDDSKEVSTSKLMGVGDGAISDDSKIVWTSVVILVSY